MKQPWNVLLALLGVLLLLGIVVIAGRVVQRTLAWRTFAAQKKQVDAVVMSWRNRALMSNHPAWRETHVVLYNAVGNVAYSPNSIREGELRQLLAELQTADRGPIDLATCDWLWKRLGKTGPHGADYITLQTPAWVEAKSWLEQADAP